MLFIFYFNFLVVFCYGYSSNSWISVFVNSKQSDRLNFVCNARSTLISSTDRFVDSDDVASANVESNPDLTQHEEFLGHQIACEGNECHVTNLQKHVRQWMAILNYSEATFSKHTIIFDQVQQAVLLGASAVLLLAINSDAIRKLDGAGVFWPKPVHLVSSNVTKIWRSLVNATKILLIVSSTESPSAANGVKHTSKQTSYAWLPTFALWSTCGRMSSKLADERPWVGTVCLDKPVEKADEAQFWTVYYAGLLVFTLLLLLKANSGHIADELPNCMAQDAVKALKRLRAFRYAKGAEHARTSTCSICLDNFTAGQLIRLLPCRHSYHSMCVDPWLLEQHTCPLCKLDIVDKVLNAQ